eukprot:jgi/Pico_ML_1/55612/g1277.t1
MEREAQLSQLRLELGNGKTCAAVRCVDSIDSCWWLDRKNTSQKRKPRRRRTARSSSNAV